MICDHRRITSVRVLIEQANKKTAAWAVFLLARPAGLEPATLGLAYQLQFSLPRVTGLWSGLSLHRLRCCTYSLYGTPHKYLWGVSTL